MENILFLAFTEADGSLHRTALEALGAAVELGGTLTVGLIGADALIEQVDGCLRHFGSL
jgi:hypothetical protein